MKKAIIIVGIVAVIGTGAYFFYKNEISKLQNMGFDVLGIQVPKATLDEVIFNVRARIYSTSTISAELSQIDLDVRINGIKVAKVTENRPIIVPAKGYSDVDIKVMFSPKQIGGSIVDLFVAYWKQRDAVVVFEGQLKVKAGIINLPTPFFYEDTLKNLMA